MWTIDCRCSLCRNKPDCPDRPAIILGLNDIVNTLNTNPKYVNGKGDGIMVVACRDFNRA